MGLQKTVINKFPVKNDTTVQIHTAECCRSVKNNSLYVKVVFKNNSSYLSSFFREPMDVKQAQRIYGCLEHILTSVVEKEECIDFLSIERTGFEDYANGIVGLINKNKLNKNLTLKTIRRNDGTASVPYYPPFVKRESDYETDLSYTEWEIINEKNK